MTDAEVCMKAARLIESDGWTQEYLFQHGRRCAVGALRRAMTGTDRASEGGEYWDLARRVFGCSVCLSNFNDRTGTTQDEVIALLESGAYSVMA